MILNQLQQTGAPSFELLPARWMALLAESNLERGRRHQAPIEFSYTNAQVDAYVNAGRWVAGCFCMGGMACSPEWPWACCLDCGHIYETMFPDARLIAAATVLLERRPLENQNWYPTDEPIRLLQAENKTHGLDDSIPDVPDAYSNVAYLVPATTRLVELGAHVGNLGLPLGAA